MKVTIKIKRVFTGIALVAILGTATYAVAELRNGKNEGKAVKTEASEKTKVKAKRQQPLLYWYQISSSGRLQSQLNSAPQTKDDAMPGGANPLTDCEDQTTADCIRGYATVQTIGIPAPAVPGDDYHVTFSN